MGRVEKGTWRRGDANGLVVHLKPLNGSWTQEESGSKTLHWKGEARTAVELETCAPCHSRRHPITSKYQPGQPLADSYVPSLLDPGVYYADGQILEEDYEYGSFLQSRMHRLGVTCSDCHNPHSLKRSSTNLILFAKDATCRTNSTRRNTIITRPSRRARCVLTAICLRKHTWLWMRGAIIASACRVRTSRWLMERPMPARSAIKTARHNGQPMWLRNGMVRTGGRSPSLWGRLTRAGVG